MAAISIAKTVCLLILVGTLTLPGCSPAAPASRKSSQSAPPPPPRAAAKVRVATPSPRVGSREIWGFIYAKSSGADAKSLCIWLFSDGKWTLTSQTGPGRYEKVLAQGIVGRTASDQFADLDGFPADALAGCDQLWSEGNVSAIIDGKEIEVKPPSKAPNS